LTDVGRRFSSHAFLANRASQLIYLYLVHYVADTAAQQFGDRQPAILDWGCGKGQISYLLRRYFQTITSCDVIAGGDSAFGQETPLITEQKINVVPLADPVRLPFDGETFDIVVGFGVLEHVKDDAGSLRELYRVLKPDGLFFCFFLPQRWSWTQRLAHLRGNYYHDRLYNFKQVRKMLDQVGFEPVEMWHRQLFPKNSINYPCSEGFERIDQLLCRLPGVGNLATNMEFLARKQLSVTLPERLS